jgi:hypothetical protein
LSSEPLKIVTPPRSVRSPEPTVSLQPLPPGTKHRFHAMVKPVGSMCNLDCTYCYYLHREELLGYGAAHFSRAIFEPWTPRPAITPFWSKMTP